MVSLVVVKPDGSLLETGVGIERPRTHSHGGHLSESASNGSDYEDNRDFKEVGAEVPDRRGDARKVGGIPIIPTVGRVAAVKKPMCRVRRGLQWPES